MIDTTGGAGDGTDGGDAFAAIWQSCVHRRFPDGQLRQVADYLPSCQSIKDHQSVESFTISFSSRRSSASST
jgi:hypothetical protein